MTAPGRLPRVLVAAGVRGLPAGARERWSREHLAELHALPPSAQLRYAFGVLVSAPALRRAAGAAMGAPVSAAAAVAPVPGVALTEAAPNAPAPAAQPLPTGPVHRPLGCRLGVWHRWTVMRTTDGQRYVACRVCRYEPERSWWDRAFPR